LQVALENLYDVGEMGMFLCALLVPVMLLAWLRFWALASAAEGLLREILTFLSLGLLSGGVERDSHLFFLSASACFSGGGASRAAAGEPRGRGGAVRVRVAGRGGDFKYLCNLLELISNTFATCLNFSDGKVANRTLGWEIAHAAVSRRPPISLYTTL
jgi:hypothetical protein